MRHSGYVIEALQLPLKERAAKGMTRIVVLSGAGLSAESGLGTFRDKGGVWTQYDLAEVATPEGFAADPAKVMAFYNARRANMVEATPNVAHQALARLKQTWQDDVLIVTQNIDDLLERAGTHDVVHMHGELSQALCARCGHRWTAPLVMDVRDQCPSCGAMATRPDVVWFGEIPYHMERIIAALQVCETFVSIGTSGTVYPAAGFVAEAKEAGARTIELNLEVTQPGHMFEDQVQGPATQIVPKWVEDVLSQT